MVGPSLGDISVVDLARADFGPAAAVLARAMRDNPMNLVVYRGDPARRERALERLYRALLLIKRGQEPLGAYAGSRLVGAICVALPGHCRATQFERLHLLPIGLANGPASAVRAFRTRNRWGLLEQPPHMHLGPVGVEPELHGQGIGTRLLTEHCFRLDAAGLPGHLETDKPENARFYERFGFEVAAEVELFGVHSRFMRRLPAPQG